MGFDQKGAVVFRCKQDSDGRWNVWEQDFEKPLATFDRKEDAYEYANQLARTKEGTVLDGDKPETLH